MSRRLLALLLTPVLAVLWFTGTGTALAHDELTSTTPSKGATVATAPQEVTLTFSDTVRTTGTAIVVKGPDGAEVQQGSPQVSGAKVTQPLKAGLPAGTFQVVWRAGSADGHPISGNFAFTVTGGASSSSTAATNSAVPPATGSSAASGSGGTVSSSASTSYLSPVPTSQTPTDSTNNQPWLIAGGVVLGLLVIGGVVAMLRTRARGDNADL
ncbi:copper resistance protein CopC [Flexivirga sp. ID2601S]|uniref:Copper resistance protein CopC n=1 Tax=Flexivirga aerilata TaxID=1656889 RepID=A0A849AHT2_9MICO|nr:copper resistance CopC family protein [Flexivirga aerilata]NNG38851.1 copper resistance protein CopC [Flexivirga aerilata]